jgi:hypothetical protein
MSTYTEHQQRELDQTSSRSLDRIASQPAIMTGSVPIFTPCSGCPDDHWCSVNTCWWSSKEPGEP